MARRTIPFALLLIALAIWAPAAGATFHLVQIREVYPGSLANPNSEYVELQAWQPDQNHVAGHLVRTYDASGAVTGSSSFPADLANGANQMTMVLATPEAEAELGFSADASLPAGRLDPGGGAVCWEQLDCVAWGSFAGSLPSPAGAPATPTGIPDGQALRRSLAGGCATLLDPLDDRDNSAADFSPVFPAPRPNAVAPTERVCEQAGGEAGGKVAAGGNGPAAARGTPATTLRRMPPRRSHDRTPRFRFGADESNVGFECRLDRARFRSCRSPFTAGPLAPGPHVFKVRARDDSGLADPSPAAYRFLILPRR